MAIKFLNTVEVDTNVLYVNTSSNRVGIVTASPRTSLDINGPLSVMGGTFTSGDSGADSISGAGIVLRRGKKLLSGIPGNGNEDFHLRNLIGHDSGNNINIGQTGTSLIGNISLSTGTSGNVIFNTIGSENLRIASNGRVGIGTTSPTAKLNVRGDLHIRHTSSSTTAFKVQGSGGDDVWFEITPNSQTVFVLGDEEESSGGGFLKLNSSGKMLFLDTEVGINTTSPTSGTKLDVNGAVKASEFYGQSMFINWRAYHSTTSIRTLYNTGMTSAFPYAYGVVGTLFKGCVSKVNVSNNPYSSYTSGPTGNSATLQVYKNGSFLQSVTSSYSNNAGEVVVFDFGQTATFNASDRLAFRFQANGLWRYVNVGILLKELI